MDDDELHVVLNFVCFLVLVSVVQIIYIYNIKPFMNYSTSAVLNILLQSS
jgi:hypothetical protein